MNIVFVLLFMAVRETRKAAIYKLQNYRIECFGGDIDSKGKSLIERFVKTTPADGIDKEAYLASVPVRFQLEQLRGKLEELFDSPIWKQQSERCLGCKRLRICLSHLCLF